MSSSENVFWQKYEGRNPVNVLDVIFREIQPKELYGFVKGCASLQMTLEQIRPDLVIYPERGAMPIAWTIRAFSELRGFEYSEIDIALGSHIVIQTNRETGVGGLQKRRVIQHWLQYAAENICDLNTVVMIDEVQSGKTLSQATHHLLEYIQTSSPDTSLHIIAVQDDRNHVLHRSKVPAFRTLSSNERQGITAQVFPMPLFTVDRTALLDYLLIDEEMDLTKTPIVHTLKNTEAETVFRLFALVLSDPQFSQIFSEAIDHQIPPSSLGVEGFDNYFYWLFEMITNPTANNHQKVRYDHICIFFQSLCRIASKDCE